MMVGEKEMSDFQTVGIVSFISKVDVGCCCWSIFYSCHTKARFNRIVVANQKTRVKCMI